jgi:hypothetical protein
LWITTTYIQTETMSLHEKPQIGAKSVELEKGRDVEFQGDAP